MLRLPAGEDQGRGENVSRPKLVMFVAILMTAATFSGCALTSEDSSATDDARKSYAAMLDAVPPICKAAPKGEVEEAVTEWTKARSRYVEDWADLASYTRVKFTEPETLAEALVRTCPKVAAKYANDVAAAQERLPE